MKKFLLNLLIPILTFIVGVGIYRNLTPNVSLENLTNYTSFYDGMNVQIETYAQLENDEDNSWYIGEPFVKRQIFTRLDLDRNSTNLDSLGFQLKENLSKHHFKRAKVLVKGIVKENCKTADCCFGNSITIKAQEVTQLQPVEDYDLPE